LEGVVGARRLGPRRAAGPAAAVRGGHRQRPAARHGAPAVVVDHVLDDGQRRRDVVVGDGAGVAAPRRRARDRTGAAARLGVAARPALFPYAVLFGALEGVVGPRRLGPRRAAGAAAAVRGGHRQRPLTRGRRAAVVVDHVLDDGQRRRDIVVRD